MAVHQLAIDHELLRGCDRYWDTSGELSGLFETRQSVSDEDAEPLFERIEQVVARIGATKAATLEGMKSKARVYLDHESKSPLGKSVAMDVLRIDAVAPTP